MTDLDSLLEKAEIKFPRPIGSGEAKNLLILISKKLPAHIGYSRKTGGYIQPNGKPHQLKSEESDLKFEGSIRRDGNLATALFKLGRADPHKESGEYDHLKFHAIPGCTLGADPDEVGIWESARFLIGEYFSQKDQMASCEAK